MNEQDHPSVLNLLTGETIYHINDPNGGTWIVVKGTRDYFKTYDSVHFAMKLDTIQRFFEGTTFDEFWEIDQFESFINKEKI